MPSLEIPELPDSLYQLLALRAERAHRSLPQQALVELQQALRSADLQWRHALLAQIRRESTAPACEAEPAAVPGDATRPGAPEALLRRDRER